MPNELHEKMVRACIKASNIPLDSGLSLYRTHSPDRPTRIPDLLSGSSLGIECLTFANNNANLDKYKGLYKDVAVVVALPSHITEVWVYDPDKDSITEKFRRDAGSLWNTSEEESVLTCKRCGHVWRPRTEIPPQRCPSCQSRYWNKAKRLGQR